MVKGEPPAIKIKLEEEVSAIQMKPEEEPATQIKLEDEPSAQGILEGKQLAIQSKPEEELCIQIKLEEESSAQNMLVEQPIQIKLEEEPLAIQIKLEEDLSDQMTPVEELATQIKLEEETSALNMLEDESPVQNMVGEKLPAIQAKVEMEPVSIQIELEEEASDQGLQSSGRMKTRGILCKSSTNSARMAAKKPGSAESGPSKAKRERKVLFLSEKIEILDLLKSGMSFAEVGRQVGKNESSIRTIKQKEAEIRANVRSDPTTAKVLSLVRDKVLVKTEEALNVWLEDMTQKHVPVDGRIVREKALSLYEHYSEGVEESERKGFKASKGWLVSYVKRYNLKNLKITGESASASEFPEEFRSAIEERGYLPEQVFNCGETGLYWKKMPNRTYLHRSAKRAPGFKAWKDRLTLVLCGNAAGHMIKPGLIYRARSPRALKGRNKNCLPVFWQHNKKAWMTATLCLEWFHKCFVPEAKRYLEEKRLPFKVLLLLGKAAGHPPSLSFANKNVKVKFLPPAAVSLLQPLDQGIIKCIKATYTRLTFRSVCAALEADPRCSIMDVWKSFTIADAVVFIAEAVDALKPETVQACWKALWPGAARDFRGSPTIDEEVRAILEIAGEVGGEGFSDMTEEDVEEHIEEHSRTLTNEELADLLNSVTDDEDEDVEDAEEAEPSVRTLEKLAAVFEQAQVLKDMILEYDPSVERAVCVTQGITTCLQPLQDLFDEAKRKLPVTTFLTNVQPPVVKPEPSTFEDSQPSTSTNASVRFLEPPPKHLRLDE
ncbi:tigger transposable element-derived protein 1-like [Tiliqua scincoides]|uniref:tigger transposable element-derived protein 1-like n=1 Tax=Tiliqua scincoides TaxID=71010 RepID=UPI003461F06E